jgi:hypothetical protein
MRTPSKIVAKNFKELSIILEKNNRKKDNNKIQIWQKTSLNKKKEKRKVNNKNNKENAN